MSLKKLSLKKETLLPMNDDQAQTVAGGMPVSIIQPDALVAGICGTLTDVGPRCSNPCATPACPPPTVNQATCASCNQATCVTCATNCNCTIGLKCSDPCRTDLCTGTGPLPNAQQMICRPY